MIMTGGIVPMIALCLQITVASPVVTVGEATEIHVSESVDEIRIVSHPEAVVKKSETVFLPEAGATMVQWVPNYAGVVSIEAGGAKKAVSVRYRGIPIAGLIVCLIAAGILFGGAIMSLRRLLDE